MVTDHFSQSGSNPPPPELEGVYELRTFVSTTCFLCVAFLFSCLVLLTLNKMASGANHVSSLELIFEFQLAGREKIYFVSNFIFGSQTLIACRKGHEKAVPHLSHPASAKSHLDFGFSRRECLTHC